MAQRSGAKEKNNGTRLEARANSLFRRTMEPIGELKPMLCFDQLLDRSSGNETEGVGPVLHSRITGRGGRPSPVDPLFCRHE